MENSKVAGKTPMMVDLEAGKNYAWCACGHSANQPWCDGSHKGTGITPTVFKVENLTLSAWIDLYRLDLGAPISAARSVKVISLSRSIILILSNSVMFMRFNATLISFYHNYLDYCEFISCFVSVM